MCEAVRLRTAQITGADLKRDALTAKAVAERRLVSRRPLNPLEVFLGLSRFGFKIVVEAFPTKLNMAIVETPAEDILMHPKFVGSFELQVGHQAAQTARLTAQGAAYV